VLADGHTAGETVKLQANDPATIRIVMNRENAVVEVSGKRLWSGPHLLNPKDPWQAGVSSLTSNSEVPKSDAVQSVRIMRPAR
jgi:hypothetical protein